MDLNHVQYFAFLLETRGGKKREREREAFQHKATDGHRSSLLPSHTQASKMFIHPLPLRGENDEFCMASLQRQKCQVCEEGWHCGAPRNPLQTPRKESSSEVTLTREEMRACLIEALLLHIHVWIWGGGGCKKTHSSNTGKKLNSKHLLFWIWRPV